MIINNYNNSNKNNNNNLTCQVQRSVGVDVSGADGASCGASLQQQAVVRPAQQLVFPQRELVSRQELPAAHRAPKALDVVHIIPGSHHQIAAAESQVAFCAFNSKQPGKMKINGGIRNVKKKHSTKIKKKNKKKLIDQI